MRPFDWFRRTFGKEAEKEAEAEVRIKAMLQVLDSNENLKNQIELSEEKIDIGKVTGFIDKKIAVKKKGKIWISDFQLTNSISEDHAILIWKDNAYWIKDVGSTHGTIVNFKEVSSKEHQLKEGDIIYLGNPTERRTALISPISDKPKKQYEIKFRIFYIFEDIEI